MAIYALVLDLCFVSRFDEEGSVIFVSFYKMCYIIKFKKEVETEFKKLEEKIYHRVILTFCE